MLFDEEYADLLRDARRALEAYRASSRDDAPEHWGRFDDVAEDLEDALLGMRDAYAESVAEPRRPHYRAEFRRQALLRFRDVLPNTAYDGMSED